MELAATLSTDSTIMALRRMIARRGQPQQIYSDNGTNLRGADSELKSAVLALDNQELHNQAANKGFEWKFIPPGAPHMGGSWERMVQTVKRALRVTLKTRAPKEEVLLTLMAEAEYTINSRPLTHVSLNPEDPEALTPNHFLLGTSSGNPTVTRYGPVDLCSRKQWQQAQALSDAFWRRWVREYLPTLIPRNIWQEDTRNLEINDVVLLVDTQFPCNTWLRGVVEETFPGKDGRVRVVKVRTVRGHYTRPTTRVIPLVTCKASVVQETSEPCTGGEDVVNQATRAGNAR